MTYLTGNQLFWLEEKPNCYVEIYYQPQGEQFLDGTKGKIVKISDLSQHIKDHPLENLWRSWMVYEDPFKLHPIGEVPAVIDIDDESDKPSILIPPQKFPDLQKAYELTKNCSAIIIEQWAKSEDNVRIVFSGHKGFHIEFKPTEPVDMVFIRRELIATCINKGLIPSSKANNIFFETTSIDSIKKEVRLTVSLNSWLTNEEHIHSRRVFQLTFGEFSSLKPEDIIFKSEFRLP